MKYEFLVQVTEDGDVTYSHKYTSAVEAVRVYDSFMFCDLNVNKKKIYSG